MGVKTNFWDYEDLVQSVISITPWGTQFKEKQTIYYFWKQLQDLPKCKLKKRNGTSFNK